MSTDFGYDARHIAEMRSVTFRRVVNFEPRPGGVALAGIAEKQVLRQALRDVLAQHEIDGTVCDERLGPSTARFGDTERPRGIT
jgi:hypothetical protein